ncbi:MAG: restriction endonuclease subunit S [Chlorobium phaeovibrioides]|nr:restriction endonuclease subunit S [Chlorobium phaeovibrioides]
MSKILPVPNGWKPAKIKDAAHVNPRSNTVDDDSLVTFLPMNAVSESGLIQGAEIRKAIDVKKGFTSFETGDVLVAKITPCFENYKGCLCTDLKNDRGYGSTEFHVLRPKKNITGEYLHILTRTHHFRGTGELNMTGTAGQKRVPTVFLNNYDFPLPQLSEQKTIANLLSTWDEAIEKTERLIHAKERSLNAYGRDLFDRRNDGNYDGWKVVKLKSVLTEHGDKSTGLEEVYSVSVHKGLINQVEHLGRSFSAANTDNYNRVHFGDIVYTKSPTGDFPLGIVKQSYTENDVIVSPLYGVFTPKTFNLGIVLDFYFSSSMRARNYLFPIVQKGAKNTIAITNKTFLSNTLHLPVDEQAQKEVAEFVFAAREEIGLLKQLAEQYKTQKRGLMQKMLTGEWRVKPEIINQYMEA